MPLLFDKYDMKDVEVTDPGLKKYINLLPILVPHSGGTHSNERFGNQEVSIIEKLINSLMRRQEYTGKKAKCYNSIKDAMDIIHEKTDKNPVQVLIDAIENSAPKEETTQITYGGISVPKAVDVSPIRRLSISIGNNTKGAVKASYKNKKNIAECLAEELMKAANEDRNSYAVSKKEEIERMAQSAR
ncbi:MAG: 30S ribosomal protein S7 [Candidatus Saliniplasma sp.]